MRRFALRTALVVALSVAPARAGDPVAAAALFQDGRAAVKRGDWQAACTKFSESQRLDPAAGTLFNLANCEEQLGLVASASQHYQQVADQLAGSDERVSFARGRIVALAPRVPRLSIRIASGAPPGARVERDGVEMGPAALGVALPIDPGTHHVVVRAPEHADRQHDVSLGEAESREIEVGPGELLAALLPEPSASTAPAAAQPTPAPSDRPRTDVEPLAPPAESDGSRSVGWIVAGGGVVALGLGGVTGLMALRDKSRMDEHCDAALACDAAGVEAADRGRTYASISTVAVIVGVAATGVGAYLVVSSPPSGRSVGVGASLAPGGGAAAVGGRF